MNIFKKFTLTLLTFIFLLTACRDKDKEPIKPEQSTIAYEKLIIGAWQIQYSTLNGKMDYEICDKEGYITFMPDGKSRNLDQCGNTTIHHGIYHVEGNKLTASYYALSMVATILKLTETELEYEYILDGNTFFIKLKRLYSDSPANNTDTYPQLIGGKWNYAEYLTYGWSLPNPNECVINDYIEFNTADSSLYQVMYLTRNDTCQLSSPLLHPDKYLIVGNTLLSGYQAYRINKLTTKELEIEQFWKNKSILILKYNR